MGYILGINDSQNDCGVALLKDGEIISAINEERVVRKKVIGGFPHQSLKLITKDINPKDIDTIAIAGFCTPPIFARRFRFLQQREYDVRKRKQNKAMKYLSDIAQGKLKIQTSKPNSTFGMFSKKFLTGVIKRDLPVELHDKPIEFLDHHLAHAASAYYMQEKDPVLAITTDGCGDGVSLTVNICKDREIKRIFEIDAKHSPGWFYGLITMALGFQWHKHEGKVTGLSARGNSKNIKENFPFTTNKGGIEYHGSHMPQDIKKMTSKYEIADVAAWVQEGLEKIMRETIQYWVKKTGLGDVVLAGGLFANVKLNQVIHEIPQVKSVYVCPHMGDGGLAVGVCLAYIAPKLKKVTDVYFGLGYSDKEILKAIKKEKVKYTKPKSIEKEVAKLLAEGKVIARFNGRMEWGPRALGNRSILYKTNDKTVNDWLNKKLKRTEFMPFAPATLWEDRVSQYENLKGAEEPARFMTITFNCTEEMKKENPGVVHVDGTARPQLVKKEDNPSYYKIIEEYKKITGCPNIINTSFNMHEEPIVMTPREAIRAYKKSRLDYLAIGPYLI